MTLLNKSFPIFQTKAYHSEKFIDITEKTFENNWSVLFFYPANFTFVCPTELEDLADHFQDFQNKNINLYSVSTDTHFSHKAWHDTSPSIQKIQFPMISDHKKILSTYFQILDDSSGLSTRTTLVFNPKQQITLIETTSDGVGRSASELLRKITAAQYTYENPGEVCPAKWTEGDKTLKPSLDLIGKL